MNQDTPKRSNYAALDGLIIKNEKTDRPIFCFGVRSQMYFGGGEAVERRLHAVRAVEKAWEASRQDFTLFQDGRTGRMKALKGGQFLGSYEEQARSLDGATDPFSMILGSKASPIGPFQVMCLLQDAASDWPSYLSSSVAVRELVRDPTGYVEATLELCSLLKPEQGTAGLAIVCEPGLERRHFQDTWPFQARFPGLDMFAATFGMQGIAERKLVLTNWLTILDDGFVADLGGVEALREVCGDLAIVHRWDGGVLIQAGAEPELGDLNNGIWPKAMSEVARGLRPLRFEEYPSTPMSLIKVPSPLDAREETLRWTSRFDRAET